MKIAVGADHAGFPVKEELKKRLAAQGHSVTDMGTDGAESADYPDFAEKVARAVASGQAERGVLVCGTGIGMSIAANKVPGARAAVVTDEFTAEMSRRHNNANIFAAGARVLPSDRIGTLLDIFLKTPYEGGRHDRRIEKIRKLDRSL